MDQHKPAISFIIVRPDRLIIPCFDITLCSLNLINNTFMSTWKQFIQQLQRSFINLETTIHSLSSYPITYNDRQTVFLPPHWTGGFVYNNPDFYNATNDTIITFINNANIQLDDMMIRNDPTQYLVNYKITPYIFINLNIEDCETLFKLAINQDSSPRIYISIICWWNYHKDDGSSCNNLYKYVEQYCCPEIFKCSYFLLFMSRMIAIQYDKMVQWCVNNIDKVKWDSDYLADTPTFCFEICGGKNVITNPLFRTELQRRGLSPKVTLQDTR